MKRTRYLILIFGVLAVTCAALCLSGCKKEADIQSYDEIPDHLPEETLQKIDEEPPTPTIPLNKIILPNGENVEEFMDEIDPNWRNEINKSEQADPFVGLTQFQTKNKIISKWTIKAHFLVDRANFQKPDEGINKPAQNGLAYVYGSRDYTVRKKQSLGSCPQYLYGLDCSGMLYHVVKAAGFPSFSQGTAATQKQTQSLQNALNTYPSSGALIVENLGRIPPSSMQTGDIVYWSATQDGEASHIGVILKDNAGTLFVYQSNGGYSAAYCISNYQTKGPNKLPLSKEYWFTSPANWEIIRMQASGESGTTGTCDELTVSVWQDHGSGGSTNSRYYVLTPHGGTPPYKYSFNTGAYTSINHFSTISTFNTCKVKDSNGCTKFLIL